MLAASGAGNKIVFAGGTGATGHSDKVDIYDVGTGQWLMATLSQARYRPCAVSAGNQIIISGGTLTTLPNGSDKVDIYNTGTGVWSSRNMHTGRQFFASASIGNKVIIAGGLHNVEGQTNTIEILDLSDNTTNASTYLLKEKVFEPSAVTVAGKLLVAGGVYETRSNSGERRYENRKTVNVFELK